MLLVTHQGQAGVMLVKRNEKRQHLLHIGPMRYESIYLQRNAIVSIDDCFLLCVSKDTKA